MEWKLQKVSNSCDPATMRLIEALEARGEEEGRRLAVRLGRGWKDSREDDR